jgi:hypothetical protein
MSTGRIIIKIKNRRKAKRRGGANKERGLA